MSDAAHTTPLNEGDNVPNVVFKCRVRDASMEGENPFTWKDVSSADLFAGKRSIVFALPGGELNSVHRHSLEITEHLAVCCSLHSSVQLQDVARL
jgi:hypothetical protein